MKSRRGSFFQQCAVAEFHGASGGKHWVDKDKGFPLDRGRGHILHKHVKLVALFLISAIGADESVLGIVEI